jgi:predicted ABC-type exoprotein transport system permease subunit
MNAPESNSTYSISKYSKDYRIISICTTISLIILFIIVVSPLNSYNVLSLISKIFVLIILIFALYQNLNINYKFSKASNISYLDDSWNIIKENLICSYVYSFFILVLIITIIKSIF